MKLSFVKLLSSLFLCQVGFGYHGTVIKIRGDVSILPPKTKKASQLKLKETVLEDSSVVTKSGAFVKIKMSDGSTLTVKPDSKVVVRSFEKKKIGMVKLIKGVVRTKVRKAFKRKDENKFILKTSSAVMGVRGTEFVTTFNPKTQKTTLLTLEGKVAMKKAEKAELVTGLKDKTPIFDPKTSKAVTRGQLTQSLPNKRELAKPVKIAPRQLASLRVNDDFKPAVNEEALQEEVKKVEEEYAQDVQAGEDYSIQESGGVVDLASGEYIKPNPSGSFNEKLKIYEADEKLIKKVDSKGQFQATLSDLPKEERVNRYNEKVNKQYQKYFGD